MSVSSDHIAQPGVEFVNVFVGKKIAGTVSLRLQELQVKCETKVRYYASLLMILIAVILISFIVVVMYRRRTMCLFILKSVFSSSKRSLIVSGAIFILNSS